MRSRWVAVACIAVTAATPFAVPSPAGTASPPAELVSIDPSTGTANLDDDIDPSISGNGDVVEFTSFPFEGAATAWTRTRSSGGIDPAPSSDPIAAVVSRNGCVVAYWVTVFSTFLLYQLVRWDRCAGTDPAPLQVASRSFPGGESVALSADGRYVGFSTGVPQAGVVDASNNVVTIVSPGPVRPLVAIESIDLSDDGNVLAIAGQPDQGTPVELHVWSRSNPSADELIGQGASPSLSADGRFAAFITCQVSGQSSVQQLTVRDRVAAATTVIPADGTTTRGNAYDPDITPDGSQIAVVYNGVSFCGAGDHRGAGGVTVIRSTGGLFATRVAEVVSYGTNGQPVKGGAYRPAISSTGRFVAFESNANGELAGLGGTDDNVWLRERPPSLSMTPNLAFGNATVGTQTTPQNITLTNTSNVIIPLGSITGPSNQFTVTSDTCSGAVLLPGTSCTVGVAFRPTAAANANSTISISGEGLTVTTALSGTGVAVVVVVPANLQITPPAADLGVTTAGVPTAPATFTVRNAGGTAVAISSVALGGTRPDQFAIATDGCSAKTLAPAATCTLSVNGVPTGGGFSDATVTVTGANGQSPSATVRMTVMFQPTLVMVPRGVAPGGITFAAGKDFPPSTPIDLIFEGEALPFLTVTSAADGTFRTKVVLPADIRLGGHQVLAVDQPLFTGVRAPLVIQLPTVRPAGSVDPAITNGIVVLVTRG